MRSPVLIETVAGPNFADVQICRKTMAALFKLGVAPLPFASTNPELSALQQTMECRGMRPSLYVVNAFGSEHLFPELDRLMGDTPAIFLRRELFSHTKCLQAVFGEMDALTASQYLGTMTPRLAVTWPYGPKNSGEVADHVAHAVRNYLESGNFTCVERACPQKPSKRVAVA